MLTRSILGHRDNILEKKKKKNRLLSPELFLFSARKFVWEFTGWEMFDLSVPDHEARGKYLQALFSPSATVIKLLWFMRAFESLCSLLSLFTNSQILGIPNRLIAYTWCIFGIN